MSLAVLGAGFQMEVIKSPNVDFDESPGSNCSHYRCVDIITNINHDSWLCLLFLFVGSLGLLSCVFFIFATLLRILVYQL